MTLSDGTESVITDIAVLIHDAPIFEDTEEEVIEATEVFETDIEVTDQTEVSVAAEEIVEVEVVSIDEEQEASVVLATKVFDW